MKKFRPRSSPSHEYIEACAGEVARYRQIGKYPERIRRDSDGVEYVIGDWSWNRMNHEKAEHIEHQLTATP